MVYDPPNGLPLFIFLLIIWIISIFLNSFLIYIIFRNKLFKKPGDLIILNILIPDFIVTVPTFIILVSQKFDIFNSSSFTCNLQGFILHLGATAQLMGIFTMSYLSRKLLIYANNGQSIKKKNLCILLSLVWFYNIGLSILTLIDSFEPSTAEIYCISSFDTDTITQKISFGFHFIFGGLIIIYTIYSYLVVFRKIYYDNSYQLDSTPQQKLRHLEVAKTLKHIVFLVITFGICWGMTMLVASVYHYDNGSYHAYPIIFLIILNTLLDPIIYILSFEQYRILICNEFGKMRELIFGKEYEPSAIIIDMPEIYFFSHESISLAQVV